MRATHGGPAWSAPEPVRAHVAGLHVGGLGTGRLVGRADSARRPSRRWAPPLAMITAVIVLSELRPIVMSRLAGNPVSISLAFVFATHVPVGPVAGPRAAGRPRSIVAELLQRKPAWKVLFNVGQYAISVTAAWLVLLAAGAAASPTESAGRPVRGRSLGGWWARGSSTTSSTSRSSAGSPARRRDVVGVLLRGVLVLHGLRARSPRALAADRHRGRVRPGSWTLLPLLLLPLMAVQKAAQMSREKEHQALHDPLTGLPNRLLLADRIDQALARGSRLDGRVTVHVPRHRPVQGRQRQSRPRRRRQPAHRDGPAARVGAAPRRHALARFGGDEFVVVCEDVPDDEIERLADRVVAGAGRAVPRSSGRPVTVTVSIGIAVASTTTDAQTMLRDADAAMYRAKAAGRNQAIVFDEAMHEQAAARLDAEYGLRQALEAGRAARALPAGRRTSRDESLVGFEALVRWEHPTRGLLSPDEFVPVAEETGLILPLGTWVLAAGACPGAAVARGLCREQQDLWIAVNLSARQLRALQSGCNRRRRHRGRRRFHRQPCGSRSPSRSSWTRSSRRSTPSTASGRWASDWPSTTSGPATRRWTTCAAFPCPR